MTEIDIVIAQPDDWHVHLRDDEMLTAVVPFTARTFRYGLVMPNLVPPITTSRAADNYRERIMKAAAEAEVFAGKLSPDARFPAKNAWEAEADGAQPEFQPLMTAYLNDDLDIDDLRRGVEQGVFHGVKYYPAGATTNSESGGTSLAGYGQVYEALAELGVPLLVHAESTDSDIDIFDRELAFLDRELAPLVAELPELAVTVEHLSTRAGVEFVASHPSVKGSITPHHLRCDRSDLLANGLRPDLYCKPIINSPADRHALVAAATSGSPDYFLGTDSAPHPTADKYTEQVKPGIFNAPYALQVVAEVFWQAGAIDHLEAFTSLNGCTHYGFQPASTKLRLHRNRLDADDTDGLGHAYDGPVSGHNAAIATVVTPSGATVTIFGAAEAELWTVTRRP